MNRGRPSEGARLVERLEGSEHAKTRAKVIIQTLRGEKSALEACRELNISESMFHKLRNTFLQNALAGLEPKPAGRPAGPSEEKTEKVQEIQKEISRLKFDLELARLREEIHLLMPHVVVKAEDSKKKKVNVALPSSEVRGNRPIRKGEEKECTSRVY